MANGRYFEKGAPLSSPGPHSIALLPLPSPPFIGSRQLHGTAFVRTMYLEDQDAQTPGGNMDNPEWFVAPLKLRITL